MKKYWLLFLLIASGCSTMPQTNSTPPEEEEKTPSVSLASALDHIQHSYTLGCVEALRSQGKRLVYPECRDKGRKHAETVRQIINQPIDDKMKDQE